jgi:hypothetical protein
MPAMTALVSHPDVIPNFFADYADLIRSMTFDPADRSGLIDRRLVLASEGVIDVCYAPFDHINERAKIVLVGITPGRQQMMNAFREAQRQLRAGRTLTESSAAAKGVASFSGPMRANLVAMLNYFGLHEKLGIPSCGSLFGQHADLVHYTSALRYPVFVNGQNYSGQPSMTRTPLLQKFLLDCFATEFRALPMAAFVPLGPKVAEALRFVAAKCDLDRILDGLPHPSGANAERVKYMIEQKPRYMLSSQTPAGPIDEARERLKAKISRLKF